MAKIGLFMQIGNANKAFFSKKPGNLTGYPVELQVASCIFLYVKLCELFPVDAKYIKTDEKMVKQEVSDTY